MMHQVDFLFSLLISVYFREKSAWFDQALESVLVNQSLLPSQIVLVEDGPLTPELYEVIEKYKAMFSPWVTVKLDQNKGVEAALNEGLKYCKYEWVARMDSDDIALASRFEKQAQYLLSYPEVDVLGCWVAEFEKDPSKAHAVRYCPEQVYPSLKFRCPLNHPTVFYKKEWVEKVGGYQSCFSMEDYNLWIRLYVGGACMRSMQEVLYLFRMNGETFKRRGGKRYVTSELEVQNLLRQYHLISYPRYVFNLVVRGGGRLLPVGIRSAIYRLFLRKPYGSN